MRVPFVRRRGVCTACGADVARGAAWCGSCGARVGADPVPTDVAATPRMPSPPPARDRSRLVAVLALVALLVGVLVAAAVRTPPAVPLLGTSAAASGLSASGPPPSGLQRAWSLSLAAEGGAARSSRDVRLVVRDGRVAAAGAVVDLDHGGVVGAVPPVRAVGSDGTGVLLVDGALVRLDVLDGTVRGRTALPDGTGPSTRPVLRTRDVTVLTTWVDEAATTSLVRDDGTVLGQRPGRPVVDLDRAVDAPTAVPLRQGPGTDAAAVLVSTTDGDVLAELPGGTPQVVDVVGDRALVASTASADVGAPGTGVPWSVALLDATDGRPLWRTRITSAVAPRLLGGVGDGSVLLVTRSGSDVGVHRVREGAGSRAAVLDRLRTRVLQGGPGFGDTFAASVSIMLRAVALDGEVVVLHDGVEEQLRALAVDGTELWRRPAPAAVGVAAADGVTAVVPLLPDQPARVLRTADGEELATFAEVDARSVPTQVPVAVLEGDLALGPPTPPGRLELSVGAATWVELATGRRRTAAEVLGDRTRVEEPVRGGWRLVGVVRDTATGRAEPVVLRDLGRDVVQLLVPGAGFRSVDLDLPDEGDVASYLSSVVGTTPTHVALRTDSFEGPTRGVTHVVDRATRASVHLEGVVGVGLRDDLLLGLVPDERGRWVEVVGHDPASGDRRWRRPAPAPDQRLLGAVDDALLVQASPVRLEAVRLADGATAWEHAAPVALDEHLVLGPTHVTVATVSAAVAALDRSDGAELWRTELGARVTAMTGAGDHVLVGTATGLVVHLDGAGREVQRIAVGTGPVRAVAAVGAGAVVVVDGEVVGLRADGRGIAPADEVELP